VIGGVTAVLATAAALGGRLLGARFGAAAEITGGVLLIAIGAVILVQHLRAG
jgi:putative Mn2+ efflux pump MntP